MRFAGLLAVADSMRDTGRSCLYSALCCIRESINGIFLAVGVESQSGICSKLVCDIRISLLMLGHSHGSFLFAVYVLGMPATQLCWVVGVEPQF